MFCHLQFWQQHALRWVENSALFMNLGCCLFKVSALWDALIFLPGAKYPFVMTDSQQLCFGTVFTRCPNCFKCVTLKGVLMLQQSWLPCQPWSWNLPEHLQGVNISFVVLTVMLWQWKRQRRISSRSQYFYVDVKDRFGSFPSLALPCFHRRVNIAQWRQLVLASGNLMISQACVQKFVRLISF